jgi:hypothetical protein
VAASTIGLIAMIAVVVLRSDGRPVPVPIALMAVLLPVGLGVLLALVLTEARRRRH